jgi:phospholipid transport system substrate-binding protein
MMVRRILLRSMMAGTLLFAAGSAGQAEAARSLVAEGLVQALGSQVVAVLSGRTMTAHERASRFRVLYLTYFDHAAIARWALGPRWRLATAEDRREFSALLEDHVVRSLARRLGDYEADRIVVTNSRRERSGIVVSSALVLGGHRAGQTIEVTWRLSRARKVYDIVVGNISFANSLRRQVATLLSRGGGTIDGLLELLKRQARGPFAVWPAGVPFSQSARPPARAAT